MEAMSGNGESNRAPLPATLLLHPSFAPVATVDVERALTFWRDVVGLPVEEDKTCGSYRWITLRIGSSPTLLHLNIVPAMPPATEKPALALFAKDVTATIDGLRARGVEIVSAPAAAFWDAKTTWATFRDSEGNIIMLQDK